MLRSRFQIAFCLATTGGQPLTRAYDNISEQIGSSAWRHIYYYDIQAESSPVVLGTSIRRLDCLDSRYTLPRMKHACCGRISA